MAKPRAGPAGTSVLSSGIRLRVDRQYVRRVVRAYREPLSSLAIAVSVVCAVLAGCSQSPPPDEQEFNILLAELVVTSAVDTKGMVEGNNESHVIVIGPDSVPAACTGLEALLKERLDQASVSWIGMDLGDSICDMPGEWTFDSDGRCEFNRTHSALQIHVLGEGDRREAEWGFVCGPYCGTGQRMAAQWDGKTWTHSSRVIIRY